MKSAFDYSTANVLITGGAGFIGCNLALKLQERYPDCNITIFDRFRCSNSFPSGNAISLGHFKNLEGFMGTVITGDINNMADLERIKHQNWDCIFHQAAISDTTVSDQHLMIQTNTNSFSFFIDLAIKNDAHLVYASSAGVYGNGQAPNTVGIHENPENVYGFSKLMMDNIQRKLIKDKKYDKITGLRYFNVFGSKEYYKGTTASMILQLGIQMINKKQAKLFKHGEQKRDFVFIDDVIQANIKAVGNPGGVYNVGCGTARSFNEIISILSKYLELEVPIEYIDNPYVFYQNNTEANIDETQRVLGYMPEFDLEAGIEKYYKEIINLAKQN